MPATRIGFRKRAAHVSGARRIYIYLRTRAYLLLVHVIAASLRRYYYYDFNSRDGFLIHTKRRRRWFFFDSPCRRVSQDAFVFAVTRRKVIGPAQ